MSLSVIAQRAHDLADELARGEGIELDQIVVLLFSEQCEPNAGAATSAEGETLEDVNRKTLGLLLSAARESAAHAGVNLAIAEVPFGEG